MRRKGPLGGGFREGREVELSKGCEEVKARSRSGRRWRGESGGAGKTGYHRRGLIVIDYSLYIINELNKRKRSA